MRRLPMLDDVRVASPCNANWNEMIGDDRVRFCNACQKSVYNLSSMLAHEAEQLLTERATGELCVRFYQRADGTMMTQDCPVGVKKKQRKKLALAVAGAGALAAAAATTFFRTSETRSCQRGAETTEVAQNATTTVDVVTPPVVVMGGMLPAPAVMGTVAAEPEPPPPPAHVMGRRKK